MDEDAHRIHDRIELPLIPILRDAKIRGVLIDVPLLKEMGEQITAELPKILDEVYDECGCVFNLNSAKQKAAVFFDKMKLPIVSYSKKTGAPSTDATTFEEWDSMGIRVGALMNEYSELNKLYTGYVKAIPNLVDEHSVLRGDLNSCGTKTGRFASTGPNLQNQPNNYHFPIREAFVPRPGYKFVNYDYSQLELRVMAHMSKDERFMDIFLHGRDPHGEVAKACNITRKQAKVMNFGVLYGMGIGKYMRTFNVAKERAIEMIDNYHKSYIGFAHWKEATENFARKHGYVKNLFGRIRVFKETTKSKFTRNEAMYYAELRQAVNTIIQGTGADIVKLATIAMCRKFKELNLDAHFLLQVHDEVLIEVREDQMMECEKVVIDCMENTVKLDVPLIADGKILANWGEMKNDDIVSYPYRFNYGLVMGVL